MPWIEGFMMWKQYKTKLILLIIAGTILLAAGVYAGFKLGRSSNNSNFMIDPNAVEIDKDYLAGYNIIRPQRIRETLFIICLPICISRRTQRHRNFRRGTIRRIHTI